METRVIEPLPVVDVDECTRCRAAVNAVRVRLRSCRESAPETDTLAAVAVERAQVVDLVHVRIEHAEGGRLAAAARRVPDGAVPGDLDLRRVGVPLRLRIERELLAARIEPPDRRAILAVGPLAEVGRPDVVVRVGGDVIRFRILLRDRPLGHLARRLVQPDQLSGSLAGRVDAPPDVVPGVDIQTPRVRRVGGGGELGPRVVRRIELDDLASAPEGDPDVVVAVGDHAVGMACGVGMRNTDTSPVSRSHLLRRHP